METNVSPKIQTALISVSDKTCLVGFATFLTVEFGVKIISTGGTAKALRAAGIAVTDISEYTGFPEMMDGRVKTLHPKVHGGLLYIRGNAEHEEAARKHDIIPIDLVVVNLYPFKQTVAKPNVTFDEAIENIDIGGPSMLRSAAKNHAAVTVASNPRHYAMIQNQMVENGGNTGLELRRLLAGDVFRLTSEYDAAIAGFLSPGNHGPA